MRLLPADFWTTELRELHKTDSISVMVYRACLTDMPTIREN